VLVGVEVFTGVLVGVEEVVEVAVAGETVTVAPDTGKPLKRTGWPLLPLAPDTLKVYVPLAAVEKLACTV
jgi:hypothetical protein